MNNYATDKHIGIGESSIFVNYVDDTSWLGESDEESSITIIRSEIRASR